MQLSPRPCSTIGCGTLVTDGQGRCLNHRRQEERIRVERVGTSTERGYDVAHRKLRVLCFERDQWRCVDCHWEPDIVRDCRVFGVGVVPTLQILEELRIRKNRNQRHLHADHQIPISTRPDLRLDLDNLRTRCNTCHNAKTLAEMRPVRAF